MPAGGFSKPCNTTGTATNGGYAEATFAWNVTMKLKAKLEKSGATVVLTRTSNREDRWGPCVDVRGRAGNTLIGWPRRPQDQHPRRRVPGLGRARFPRHLPARPRPVDRRHLQGLEAAGPGDQGRARQQGVLGRQLHRRRRRPGRAFRPRHPQPLRRPGRDAGGGEHARQRRRGGHDVRARARRATRGRWRSPYARSSAEQRLRHGLVNVVVDSGSPGDNRVAPELGRDDRV